MDLKTTESGLCLPPTLRPVDGLRFSLDRLVIPLPNLLEHVPHLMHPATLMRDSRVDGLQGGRQSRAAIGDDQQQVPAFQATSIQILQQPLPGGLALAL